MKDKKKKCIMPARYETLQIRKKFQTSTPLPTLCNVQFVRVHVVQ